MIDLIHRKNAQFHGVFLKICHFYEKFTERLCQIHRNFMHPTQALVSCSTPMRYKMLTNKVIFSSNIQQVHHQYISHKGHQSTVTPVTKPCWLSNRHPSSLHSVFSVWDILVMMSSLTSRCNTPELLI